MRAARQATVLIVVAGIAAMLAAVMMVFLARVRGEADKSRLLVQEAQARVMLNAALMYIQETSRLGWGSECFGWSDVRDGSLGPRGPVRGDGTLPTPSWWSVASYGAYPPGAGFPNAGVTPSLRWPAPGAAMQGDLFAWNRPPYAIELTYAYIPVPYDPIMAAGSTDLNVIKWPFLRNAYAAVGAKGSLTPQPIASTWNAFQTGEIQAGTGAPVVFPGSAGLGWFRIYREKATDRDNDGDPWYDRVSFPIDDNSTFIIACGAGGTRGYRWWTLPDAASRALEPVTASESGVFVDQTMFNDLMLDNRILWYRVEWSGATGGNFNPVSTYFDNGGQYRIRSVQSLNSTRQLNGLNPINQVGTIKWIQRLDREPPSW